ncbi:hypothetical protein LB505_001262 [Fusarium chuoi]|nr:hypothetical protein LB505_001262 [Fusarium chuoi]
MILTSLCLCRQSKLSQDQLVELQKSTHFDKKELQQWYKGLPLGYTHQGGVPENLQTILPLRRPELVRRLCIQRLR